MITITNAWNQRGWSGTDHLIDDSRMADIIGRSYSTVGHARRAVEARADRRGSASFEYRDGSRYYSYDCSPAGIPGRHVQRIREIHAATR